MPQTNQTIDNISPLIVYTAGWQEGTAADVFASSYSNSTFTLTLCSTQGSYATFTFNGTAIWIFGAKRPNHGPYSVALDNIVTFYDGYADPEIFQTPLFATQNLADTTHTVIITNQETNANVFFLDIDFITWTSAVGNYNETITEKVFEDTTYAFSYQPAGAWATETTALTGFSLNTAQ
ncbi:hypothetical protein B0H16DRAFT_1321151 [Mycena metata]|uniref:Uncharacterized protein n=1 Tax=Mycena metata TaxID=1033252 RepID=A0AAD7IM04_9AGAR|nr:hypothetical protein B0H16DRAFT_1321151 [Mycena metata]